MRQAFVGQGFVRQGFVEALKAAGENMLPSPPRSPMPPMPPMPPSIPPKPPSPNPTMLDLTSSARTTGDAGTGEL